MKKIKLLLILSAVVLVSCESFLDEQIKGEFTSKNIFNTAEDADLVLTGAYNSMTFTSASNMIWVFGDVASDDAVKGGNPGDGSDIQMIDNFEIKSNNGALATFWKFTYEGINRCNNLIEGLNNSSGVDNTIKQNMIAEAKFIRAYHYFNLVNIWGKVPLRLQSPSPQNSNMGLSSVETIYSRIEQDLNEAKSLPVAYTTNNGRITKGAVLGLLVKAKIYQKKWSEALMAIDELEVLGTYKLENSYADLFKLGAEESKEVVFAVRHLSKQSPGLGNSLNQWFAPSSENGYYFNAPTASYVAAFDEQTIDGKVDPRLDVSIGRSGATWLNGEPFDPTWSVTGYLVRKHNQPLAEVSKGTKGDGGLAYINIRYADILLMKAEALMEVDDLHLADAVKELNKVRSRVSLVDTRVINKSQVRDAIYTERRRELGFEFHRFFDLMRWGKEVATAALGSNFTWQEPRFYFPIPLSEIDSNHGIK